MTLLEDDAVENKILSSRLALSILDKAGAELNDLRLRVLHLEGTRELTSNDVLRPEMMAQTVVEQWTKAGLSREVWSLVQDVIQLQMLETLTEGYQVTNPPFHQCACIATAGHARPGPQAHWQGWPSR